MATSALGRLVAAVARGRRRVRRHARRTLAVGHRTIVVPLLEPAESRTALDLACRLAADRRAHVLLIAPLFIDAELPLDAHFHLEERVLQDQLAQQRAHAESYGVAVKGRIVRARPGQLGAAVADAADEQRATLVVLGAPNDAQRGFRRAFSRDVWSILQDAPCRVMIVAGQRRPGLQAAQVA
jgi:nucleotide-binding universal stress UspA family protein